MRRVRFPAPPLKNRIRSYLKAPTNLAKMAAGRRVTNKILTVLLALGTLAIAG